MVWIQVEEALDAIIYDYVKVNHVISIFQDEKVRNLGLSSIGKRTGVGLELGIGPGNFTPRILGAVKEELICLDFSADMIKAANENLDNERVHFVRSVFEYLPIREGTIGTTIMSFSLRDSQRKGQVIDGVKTALGGGGCFLIIDIGRPENLLIEHFIALYIRYLVPVIGGLITGRGCKNPWNLLYKTYNRLPRNRLLRGYLEGMFSVVTLKEYSFGGLITLKAVKNGA